jgi:hypothetical protein
LSSTPVENVRQIDLFLRNKPNFPHFSPKNNGKAKKQTQTNPNEPNFILGAKMMQTRYLQRIKKMKADWLYFKQSQFKSNFILDMSLLAFLSGTFCSNFASKKGKISTQNDSNF